MKSYGLNFATRDLLPRKDVRFLEKLPLFYSDGVRLFTHAGVSPYERIEDGNEDRLLWHDGLVRDIVGRLVVHGHIMQVEQPLVSATEVNVDTGAYQTGRLTCAIFKGRSRKPTFLSVSKLPPS